jgi:hypothetical protein
LQAASRNFAGGFFFFCFGGVFLKYFAAALPLSLSKRPFRPGAGSPAVFFFRQEFSG